MTAEVRPIRCTPPSRPTTVLRVRGELPLLTPDGAHRAALTFPDTECSVL